MFVAFFSFAQAIRLFNHVGYMINVPATLNTTRCLRLMSRYT